MSTSRKQGETGGGQCGCQCSRGFCLGITCPTWTWTATLQGTGSESEATARSERRPIMSGLITTKRPTAAAIPPARPAVLLLWHPHTRRTSALLWYHPARSCQRQYLGSTSPARRCLCAPLTAHYIPSTNTRPSPASRHRSPSPPWSRVILIALPQSPSRAPIVFHPFVGGRLESNFNLQHNNRNAFQTVIATLPLPRLASNIHTPTNSGRRQP